MRNYKKTSVLLTTLLVSCSTQVQNQNTQYPNSYNTKNVNPGVGAIFGWNYTY